MANYFDYASHFVTNPDNIGLGLGNDTEGKLYICVAGLKPIDEQGYDWTALTPECAKHLYFLLKDTFETYDSFPKENLDISVRDGWSVTKFNQRKGSFLALLTFKKGDEEVNARLDIGKMMFIDPLPLSLTKEENLTIFGKIMEQ